MKAALLDAPAASGNGVYLRIDELASAADLTDCHVPTITECDLPPGRYVWVPNADPRNVRPNKYGGEFVARELLAAGVPLDKQGQALDAAETNMRRAIGKIFNPSRKP